MEETFGRRLKRFALAIDIVDETLFRNIWDLIVAYLEKELDPQYCSVLTVGYVNDIAGLKAIVCRRGEPPSFNVRRGDGSYNGLAGYAYDRFTPLWVVAENEGPISPGVPLRDLWAGAAGLPGFDRSADERIHTAIMIPLGTRERKVGLFDVQSTRYHEVTQQVKNEFEDLADALASLVPLLHADNERREHTKAAMTFHNEALLGARWPPLAKPQLFLSSSNGADHEVMAVIDDVLEQFRDRIRVHYWRESSADGNISVQTISQIHDSQFGICYFSEPDHDSGELRFVDNPNVLFEAGMMQARAYGWIPIREAASHTAPFNFAQHRMVIVERKDGKMLKTDKLRSDLVSQLTQMIVP